MQRQHLIFAVPDILRAICADLRSWRVGIMLNTSWRAALVLANGPQNPWDWRMLHLEPVYYLGSKGNFMVDVARNYLDEHGYNETSIRKLLRVAMVPFVEEVHEIIESLLCENDRSHGTHIMKRITAISNVINGNLPATKWWLGRDLFKKYGACDYYVAALLNFPTEFGEIIEKYCEESAGNAILVYSAARTPGSKMTVWRCAGKSIAGLMDKYRDSVEDLELMFAALSKCDWQLCCKIPTTLAALQWWRDHGRVFDRHLWTVAIKRANLEILTWALDNVEGFNWDVLRHISSDLSSAATIMGWITANIERLIDIAVPISESELWKSDDFCG